MRGHSTISKKEFLILLEIELCDVLKGLLAQNIQATIPHDRPWEVVKVIADNFEAISQLNGVTFNASSLRDIFAVFKDQKHNAQLKWQQVEEAVGKSIEIIKAVRKDGAQELADQWTQVAKLDNAISLLKQVAELPPFLGANKADNDVKVELKVPNPLISDQDDIVEHLKIVEDIDIQSADTSQKGTIILKVASPSCVECIIPEFNYKRQKVLVQLMNNFSITLHPLPDEKNETHVKLALRGEDITPVAVHPPNRADKSIVVELSSQADVDYIKEKGLTVKPQKMIVRENKLTQFVVYMESPVKSPEHFKAVWENHFEFLPEFWFSEDLRSALCVLDATQLESLKSSAPLLLNKSKALIVPFSDFRCKLLFSSPVSDKQISSCLESLISNIEAISIHLPQSDMFQVAYVHTNDQAAKKILLETCNSFGTNSNTTQTKSPTSSQLDVGTSSQQSSSSGSTGSSSSGSAGATSPGSTGASSSESTGASSSQPNSTKRTHFTFSVNDPRATTTNVVAAFNKLYPEGPDKGKNPAKPSYLSAKFVFERDGIFYVDVQVGTPEIVEQVQHITIGEKQVQVQLLTKDAPYYFLQLENVPTEITVSKLLNYFKFVKTRVGRIMLEDGIARIPMTSTDLEAYVKKREIIIDNVSIRVKGAGVENSIPLQINEAAFLKKKKKDEIENIALQYSVKVHIAFQAANAVEKQGRGKRTDQKPKAPKQVLTVRGSTKDKVDQAIESVKFLLSENDNKVIQFKFLEPLLLQIAESKLRSRLHEFDTHNIVHYVGLKPEKSNGHVLLFGEPTSVEEAAQSVGSLLSELTTDDSLTVQPSLKLNIKELETKYDVRIDFNTQSKKLKVCGLRDSVADFVEHIQAKKNATKTFTQIKLSQEQYTLIQRKLSSDEQWQAEVKKRGVAVTANEKSSTIKFAGKPDDIRILKDQILGLKATIHDNNDKERTVTIDKHLFETLVAYAKSSLAQNKDVVVRCQQINQTEATSAGGDEESLEFDDNSSVSSDLSVGSTSNIKGKRHSNQISVNVEVWYFASAEKEISQTLAVIFKGPQTQRIKFNEDEVQAIKGINYFSIKQIHQVNIFVDYRNKNVIVSGYLPDSAQRASEVLKSCIEHGSTKIAKIPLLKHVFLFLKHKRAMYLMQLKQQLNLKRVELHDSAPFKPADYAKGSKPKQHQASKYHGDLPHRQHAYGKPDGESKHFVTLEGPAAKVTRATEELKNYQVEKRSVKLSSQNRNQINDLTSDLRDNYDVATFYENVEGSDVEFTVVGEKDMATWPEIQQKLDGLKGVTEEYKPSDYARLSQLVFAKKEIDLASFTNECRLTKKPFFQHGNSVVILHAQNREDLTAAIAAFEAAISNTRIETITIELKDDLFHFICPRAPYAHIVEQVRTTSKGVTFRWHREGQKRLLSMRGQKDIVDKVKLQIEPKLQHLETQMKTECVSISAHIAAEFEKDNWQKAHECLEKCKVYIKLDDGKTSKTSTTNKQLFEHNTQKIQLQVVHGDILSEPSESIVNCANQDLLNAGGIAFAIENKGGVKIKQECQAVIARQGKVPVGKSVITSAGDIQLPIKHVIHTVGPIWAGGANNEANDLRSAVNSVLTLATEHKIASVSLPAISTGIYGYPAHISAAIISYTIVKFAQTYSSSTTLKCIRLCEKDLATAELLATALKEACGGGGSASRSTEDDNDAQLAYQWSWLENNGKWIPFDSDQNYQIEIGYLSQGKKGKMQTTIKGDLNQIQNGFSYEINFDNMTELNTHYRANNRPIKREPVRQTRDSKWEVQMANNAWQPLNSTDNQQVELAYFRKTPSIKLGGCIFDFNKMTETNTGMRIRRCDSTYEQQVQDRHKKSTSVHVPPSPQETGSSDEPEAEATVQCVLVGLPNDLPNGRKWLNDKISEMTTTETINYEHNVPAAINNELKNIRTKHGIRLVADKNKLILTGLRMAVVQAKSEILEIERTGSSSFKNAPPYWEQQVQDLELKVVAKGSNMWSTIEKRMRETMATIQIHHIQRVQNLLQWEKYCFFKDRVQRKYDPQELHLFHGTRNNAPSVIYQGDDGFDFRYSNQGMWGRASYFAQNASYSHGYSSQEEATGLRQMFYARVVVGKNAHLDSNSSILKPPEGYDSVSGVTGGSKVFMVYENGHAYPEYLITYSA